MNNLSKKLVFGTVAVATISTSAGGVYAQDATVENTAADNHRTAWRQAAHQAIDSGDYAAWVAAQHQAFERRTSKERFELLQSFHKLLADGKQEEAKTFAKQNHLGLKKVRQVRHRSGISHKL